MKLPYISEKSALIFVIPAIVAMLIFGIMNWPDGKSAEEIRLKHKMHQDSLKNAGKPEVLK